MTSSTMQAKPGQELPAASDGAGEQAAKVTPVSDRLQKWATRLLLGYFGLRLVFLALAISSYVPPDEVTHAGLCQVFSRVWLLPANGPETYQFGLVTDIPWLYYWTMGKLLHLNVSGLPDLVFLRLLNIPLAFGTVWYALRLLGLLTEDRLTRLLLLVALTNTAMFSLLSASVSSDNATNMLATMAIFYTLAFFKQRSGSLLAASFLCQLAGCLTKITFLPLVLVLGLLLACYALLQFRPFLSALREYLSLRGPARWQVPLLLLALGLDLQLHAGNYLHFGTLVPAMATVTSTQSAMQYRITARDHVFSLYQEGKISYMDALQMAGDIPHPGDKADAFFLLMNYENLKAKPSLWMGPAANTRAWIQEMTATIFGIKAHLPMYKKPVYLVPIFVVLALALAGFLLRWRPRESGWLALSLLAIACYYDGFLLMKINYPAYQYYGVITVAQQGRYLFPALVPVYVLASLYLLRLFRAGSLRVALAVATALILVCYDFPWFLSHASPEWYVWLPK